MDGHIVGSMISANSITGEQIQANSIKTANLELSVQKKIQDATDEETVKALIKADLDGFESTLSKEFVTVENAATQIQQATEVAVKEATQNIIDNAVSESMGAVDGQLNDKLNQYTDNTLLPAIAEKAEEVLQNAEDYVVTQLESYATKKELSSSISQTREQIELSVSEKYTTKAESATIITEAIDGITVGAINRVLGTGENKSFKFNGGANETWLPYKFSNDISDKEVFVSFKYTLTGTAQNGSQIEFAPSYLKKTNNQTVYRPKHIFFTSNRLQDVNITDTVSFTTKDFQDISPSSTSYIRFVGNGFTGTLSISEVQIKPGNSKTTWSPAPEDTVSDINDAKNEAINSANGTLIATISNYYTKSETDSAISVAKDEINLGVSNTYETKANVETKINNINVGGRNYVRDYMFEKQDIWQRFRTASTLIDNNNNFGRLSTADGSVWFYQVMPFETFKQGQVVTIQYEIKCEDISQNTGTNSMLVRTQLTGYDNNGTHIKDICILGTHEKEVDNLGEWTKVTVTKTIGDVGASTQIHLRLYARNFIGKVYFRNVKLELGNKATDLSPAPEDIESNANDYTTQQLSNYYTKEETNSQINIAKEAINLGVSSTYETKINVTNAINSAKSYADTKKTEAINSANSTLSTTIQNYYTKTETNSQINIAKNAVTTSVSNLRSEVMSATYTNLLENSDFLILDSGFPRGYSRYTIDSNTSVSMSDWNLDGGKAVRITSTRQTDNVWIAMFSPFVKAYKGETFTASVFITTNDYTAIDNQVAVEIEWHSDSGRIGTSAHFFTKTYNGWERQSVTGIAPDGTTKARMRVHVVKNGTIYVTKMMLQTGGILTNWVKGGNIDAVSERLTNAEQKITDTAITNVVKQNFYTKTETENAITSKDYATKSEVQQTANNITYKFSQSGGYNLIRNGNPKPNNYRHWWVSSNGNWYLNRATDIGIQTTSTNEAYVGSANFKVESGKTYSVSCWLMAEVNTKGADVYFIGSANDDGAYTEVHHIYNGSGDGVWKQVKGTFTVGSNINYGFIRVDNNGRKDTSTTNNTVVFFSEVQMVKGSECYPQWSPNPNEVYDGITTIDKDGITVTHSNANTKSTMSADGFKVVRTSDNKNLFNATSGNLTMEGTLATGTSGKYIKMSDSNYKVYDGSTQKAFFGLASNDVWTNVPKLYMGIRGVGESANYDYFSINTYDASSNPQSYSAAYLDLAYYNINRKDYSNIKMYGDGIIRISPLTDLIITSNTNNGSYGGTEENVIAKFSTSVSSNYNGHLDVGAITNHDKNANGLVLEHNRNGVWCAARVNVDSNNEKFFRPMANSADMKCGSSGFKWHSVWASNGSVQTSDERHKMKMGVLDNEECYQMVKNTDIYKYCMLPKSKDDMSEDEIKKMAKKASKEEIAIQTGIMAQDILGYDCAKYVLTHDSWLDEENNEEKEMYNINPYGFTSVIMGALKEEISKREALEKRVEILEEKLSQLISLQKQKTQE